MITGVEGLSELFWTQMLTAAGQILTAVSVTYTARVLRGLRRDLKSEVLAAEERRRDDTEEIPN